MVCQCDQSKPHLNIPISSQLSVLSNVFSLGSEDCLGHVVWLHLVRGFEGRLAKEAKLQDVLVLVSCQQQGCHRQHCEGYSETRSLDSLYKNAMVSMLIGYLRDLTVSHRVLNTYIKRLKVSSGDFWDLCCQTFHLSLVHCSQTLIII